jgi:hypothetical protein
MYVAYRNYILMFKKADLNFWCEVLAQGDKWSVAVAIAVAVDGKFARIHFWHALPPMLCDPFNG